MITHISPAPEPRGRWMTVSRNAGALLLAGGLAAVAGCATVPVRNPVPEAFSNEAIVPNLPTVRFWGDAAPPNSDMRIAELIEQRKQAIGRHGASREANFLALSSGGSNGAFGAGLLVGWTEAGTRPQFDLVTGVSTGSLAAPFAFLGSAYDPALRAVYTEIDDADIYARRGLVAGLAGESFADSHPLRSMIERYVTDELLVAIAAEHARGRRLAVATTNLDAQRPVFWDMGEIATLGGPRARSLFTDVLLASASVPGVLPPVHIDVVANGTAYEEIHVDGGTTRDVFLLPEVVSLKDIDRRLGRKVRRNLYIVRNGKTTPEFEVVEARALPIMGRSISTLIKNQSDGDLYRLYTTARRDGIDYNVASIPREFDVDHDSEFDRTYMRALFDTGYALGRQGYRWEKTPPGLRQ